MFDEQYLPVPQWLSLVQATQVPVLDLQMPFEPVHWLDEVHQQVLTGTPGSALQLLDVHWLLAEQGTPGGCLVAHFFALVQ